MLRRGFSTFLLVFFLTLSGAHAGQVRILVGPDGGMTFSPAVADLNQGDQVVWIWDAVGSHTVTQGNPCAVTSPIFDTGLNGRTGARFTWRSDRTGDVKYFCRLHCGEGMTGILHIVASGAPVADFRITEVKRSGDQTDDFVEITNMGTAAGNLGWYYLSTLLNASGPVTLPSDDIPVLPGGRVVLHVGISGPNTPTDIFVAGTINAVGHAALYTATSVAFPLDTSNEVVDYVRWGTAATPSDAAANTAIGASLWNSGQFVPVFPAGSSIQFCGTAADHGPSFWSATNTPSPHTDGCAVPVKTETWGGVKALRR